MKSKTDYTLFRTYLLFFVFWALLLLFPMLQSALFSKMHKGSIPHSLLFSAYILVFLLLPAYGLSWCARTFEIENGTIKVSDFFGLRDRTFTLPGNSGIRIIHKSIPYRYQLPFLKGGYSNFRILKIVTAEGVSLEIQSRYVKNFTELLAASRSQATNKH
ncbi:MAG: hypothetical protein MUF42_09385 [Cytophagaceae bacterium]|nr:hypothetical protein [Cytophagaceae bacterium]